MIPILSGGDWDGKAQRPAPRRIDRPIQGLHPDPVVVLKKHVNTPRHGCESASRIRAPRLRFVRTVPAPIPEDRTVGSWRGGGPFRIRPGARGDWTKLVCIRLDTLPEFGEIIS